MPVIPWVKATDAATRLPVWLNLSNQSTMMHFSPEDAPAFTRVWSGSAGAILKGGETQIVPFYSDVQETPEQLFMKLYDALPGEHQ